MHTVVLRKGREKSVVRRHPWIFSGAIDSADADIAPGETVLVRAADGAALGYGWHSPASQIRVRMLTPGPDAPDVAKLVADRIAACKTYEGAAYTDASPLRYLDRAQESRLVHPRTMARLRFLLTMLAEQGESETFRFMRETVLRGRSFAE